jgi:hypothetical protein
MPFSRQGMVVLTKVDVDPGFRQGRPVPCFREKAAVIAEAGWCDFHNIGKSGWRNLHI